MKLINRNQPPPLWVWLVCALASVVGMFWAFSSPVESPSHRWNNDFIHFSEVYAYGLIPEEVEDKYDSILWAKEIGPFNEEQRGIIYEAEVAHLNPADTFWTAYVVTEHLKGGCIITVMSEGMTVDEAATTLIDNLEFIYSTK